MNDVLSSSVYFGIIVTLAAYGVGCMLRKRVKFVLFNPLLVAIAATIAFLVLSGIEYRTYMAGAKFISMLLTPSTICLAIPFYEKMAILKKSPAAIFAGIFAGIVTSALCILAMCMAFRLEHVHYVTLLPKSITTAIGIGVSQELGGYVTLTVAVIIITGIFGNIFAELILRMFRIQDCVARGVALGTASHAIGTAKAIEMGKVEGAVSSLALVVAGVVTVVVVGIAADWM